MTAMPEPRPKRVVSLIASATEIVDALGCAGWMVGRSHECDYPESVLALPQLTEPKFPVTGTSYEIDQRVKAILQEGLSVYRVDAEKLAAVRPDVIVTQDHCEVCAVGLGDVEEALRQFTGGGARIVSLHPDGLDDLWTGLHQVAEALGVPERAERAVAGLRGRMSAIAEKASGLAARPRVACIEWIDPLMSAGNWMPELVAMAGGENLFGEAGGHSPWMSWEELRASDPDMIILLPCGFDIARTRQEMPVLAAKQGWDALKAVRGGNVVIADGNRYFNRPGPRLVESLEILAELFHPEAFSFGHAGTGWVRHSARKS